MGHGRAANGRPYRDTLVRYQREKSPRPDHVGAAIGRVIVPYPTNPKMGT